MWFLKKKRVYSKKKNNFYRKNNYDKSLTRKLRTGYCFDKNKNTKIETLNRRVSLSEKHYKKKWLSVFETKVKKMTILDMMMTIEMAQTTNRSLTRLECKKNEWKTRSSLSLWLYCILSEDDVWKRKLRRAMILVCSRLKVFTLRRVCMRSTGGIARAIEDIASWLFCFAVTSFNRSHFRFDVCRRSISITLL